MCGRFTLTVEKEALAERYEIGGIPIEYTRRYNMAPTQWIPAVFGAGSQIQIRLFRWGLIPSWSKDEKIGRKIINARAESLFEKPSFKDIILKKRCIIPADSFYEWKKHGTDKQPIRIMMKDESIFSLAGLYDTWTSPDGRVIPSCTVITTVPNQLMSGIHDRMPVILRKEDEQVWMNPQEQNPNRLKELLVPYDPVRMKAYPVSPMVGNVRNDHPSCIEPDSWQMELF